MTGRFLDYACGSARNDTNVIPSEVEGSARKPY